MANPHPNHREPAIYQWIVQDLITKKFFMSAGYYRVKEECEKIEGVIYPVKAIKPYLPSALTDPTLISAQKTRQQKVYQNLYNLKVAQNQAHANQVVKH